MGINRKFLEIGILATPNNLNWLTDSCYGDRLNSAVLNYNGDIFKCSAVDYYEDHPIGHIDTADLFTLLNNDFQTYVEGKMADPACRNCRILPMCTRGCYKRVMIHKEGCVHPTDEEKDRLVISALEEMAFSHLVMETVQNSNTNLKNQLK